METLEEGALEPNIVLAAVAVLAAGAAAWLSLKGEEVISKALVPSFQCKTCGQKVRYDEVIIYARLALQCFSCWKASWPDKPFADDTEPPLAGAFEESLLPIFPFSRGSDYSLLCGQRNEAARNRSLLIARLLARRLNGP